VLSVVSMEEQSSILIDRQPTDWLLFNKIIDLLRSCEPHFNGNYLPALKFAEELLVKNTRSTCALSLFFLSDGKPSDRVPPGTGTPEKKLELLFQTGIDAIASRFGRRLTVAAVGFAGPEEDFSMLRAMASRSADFGSCATFHPASLSVESLGTALSSLASSLTATQTEMTELDGSSQRAVRNVRREERVTADDNRFNPNWMSYPVVDRFQWSTASNGWVNIASESATSSIAVRTRYFGEGAERLVRKFREMEPSGTFTGQLMVAKEGRFDEDLRSRSKQDFHKVFCATQAEAQMLAEKFNERLEKLPGVDALTPRVSFLECSVFFVHDETVEGGRLGMLVEKQLDNSKYRKWNDNTGYVHDQAPLSPEQAGQLEVAHLLDAIAEDDEEYEEEDDDEDAASETDAPISINPADIPQAFSHFTHRYTNRKMLVCDLQGVLTKSHSAATFEFTDPVIHYKSNRGRKNVYGRTDRGPKGMNDFYRSHVCSALCKMLNKHWVRPLPLDKPVVSTALAVVV